ncbi:MAG: YfcC family protein, partial [Oscillospiraceae bacterium]|nr:YfcC family protein [Oscillospiraceae bacterium]
MDKLKDKLLNLKMPHTYVILTFILLAVVVMTWLVPAGEYDRVLDEASGKMVVLPDSFHYIEGDRPGLFDVFLALQRGYVSGANILFLIVFAYGYVYMLTENGTLNSAIQVLIRRMGQHTHLLIPVCMILFGLLGATLGIFEEVYGLVPVLGGIMAMLGYDRVVGGAVVYVGVATGFAAALTNPFSVGIAQTIAEVPLNSGIGYRAVIFVVFQGVSIWYVMRYAARVKADPARSILYGEVLEVSGPPQEEDIPFTLRRKLCLALFFVTIGTLLYGTTQLGWYIDEIAAMFLM